MKFGFRTPSFKKSISARTVGKVKRQAKKAINPMYGSKGMGLINNPSKAVYNKVYNKTTKSLIKNYNRKERKSKMLNWQSLVSPEKYLFMNEQQLIIASEQSVTNDLKIIQDCITLMDKTKKPDVFFSRLDLLEKTANHLVEFEKYIQFDGVTPTQGLNELLHNKDRAIELFLHHYWDITYEKAGTLKTDKGKYNTYKKFRDTLQPYERYFNYSNMQFYKNMSEKYMSFFINKT